MESVLRWIGFAAGVLIVCYTIASIVTLLISTRTPARGSSLLVVNAIRRLFVVVAGSISTYEREDRFLAMLAPVALLVQLVTWLALLVVGFALMLWPLTSAPFSSDIREAGSALFTLGFASTPESGPTFVDFVASGLGLIVIALVIAYLPSLYSAYNRRETLVTWLQGRAGLPAWGPELLGRHQRIGRLDALPDLYSDWERWSADISESHTNYPVLLQFRSQHPYASWVVSLIAVLDAAALQLSLCPDSAPPEARLCLRMGFTALRNIAEALGIEVEMDPRPEDGIDLGYAEFEAGVDRMRSFGFPIECEPADAWPHFRGWRVNYESAAYALADYVLAVPAAWSGPRTHMRSEMVVVPIRIADRRPRESAAESEGV